MGRLRRPVVAWMASPAVIGAICWMCRASCELPSTTVIGWLVAGRFLRPLRTITATARDISANNLNRRLALTGGYEFTQLGDTLDDLFRRLEASLSPNAGSSPTPHTSYERR